MKPIRTFVPYLTLTAALGLGLGCEQKKQVDLAPSASALGPATPAAPGSVAMTVDTGTSSTKFLMDSPLEKIDGDAPASVQGDLFVNPQDLTKSTGLIKIDLQKLTLYQQKREDEKGEYSERSKSDKQNEHARDWLQIVPKDGEVTAEQAEMNRWVEFKIEKLETATPNVTTLTGAERKVPATVTGDFRLHGRKAKKTAKLDLTFKYAGDKLESVHVKSTEAVPVKLEEFEVHPRDAAGKVTKKITEAISGSLKGKVSGDAPVMFEFTAKPK